MDWQDRTEEKQKMRLAAAALRDAAEIMEKGAPMEGLRYVAERLGHDTNDPRTRAVIDLCLDARSSFTIVRPGEVPA